MKINIRKSVEKARIVRDRKPWEYLIVLFDNLIWMIWPCALIFMLFSQKSYKDFSSPLYFLLWLPVAWYVFGFFYIDKLANIGKKSDSEKSELLKKIIENYNVTIRKDQDNIVILKRETTLKWGKEITIIFHEGNAWVNLTTLGRHDIKSPFHSYPNYKKLYRDYM